MDPTHPLHFRMRRDAEGKAFMQTKHTCDSDLWSNPVYHWTNNAPRPSGRPFQENFSGLEPSDLCICPRKNLSQSRIKELKSALDNVASRLTELEKAEMYAVFEELKNSPSASGIVGPLHNWTFQIESDDVESDEPVTDLSMHCRPTHIQPGARQQLEERANRQRGGCPLNSLIVGNFVAFTTNYTDDTKEEQKQAFWLGKVVKLFPNEDKLQIKCWHTNTLDNTNAPRAKYRAYTGAHSTRTIELERVLYTFTKLSQKGSLIQAPDRRQIEGALRLVEADRQRAANLASLAIAPVSTE